MNIFKQKLALIVSFLAVIVLPLLAAYISYDGVFPKDYFNYPSLSAPPKPGFNIWWFVCLSVAVLFVATLYMFPKWYGFKKVSAEKPKVKKVKLPVWFWLGAAMSVFFLYFQWGHFSEPKLIVYFGYFPAFWGYIIMADAIVYKRTGGKSFFASHMRKVFPLAVFSGIGWLIFGYLNFFVHSNWFYPIGDRMSTPVFIIYAIMGASTLIPLVFETYHFLATIKWLRNKYSKGPILRINNTWKIILILLCCIGMFLVSFQPYELYPLLWIGPVGLIVLTMELFKVWTPFSPIAKNGNWTPLALIALAGLIQGLLWEGTNFFAASHEPFHTEVPGYWVYSIPYVEIFHVFEMPVLGLFGYLPYGIFCWVLWVFCAKLFNIPHSMDDLTN